MANGWSSVPFLQSASQSPCLVRPGLSFLSIRQEPRRSPAHRATLGLCPRRCCSFGCISLITLARSIACLGDAEIKPTTAVIMFMSKHSRSCVSPSTTTSKQDNFQFLWRAVPLANVASLRCIWVSHGYCIHNAKRLRQPAVEKPHLEET